MTKRGVNRRGPGKPRTGTGDAAKGKKPTETGILQMRSGGYLSSVNDKQPKGWGIAKVVDIFTRKTR